MSVLLLTVVGLPDIASFLLLLALQFFYSTPAGVPTIIPVHAVACIPAVAVVQAVGGALCCLAVLRIHYILVWIRIWIHASD
jgi:hypothetical protein